MKTFIAGLIIGVILAVPSIAVAQRVFDKSLPVGNDVYGGVNRFDDQDFKVKCWVFSVGYKGGISCLPWDEVEER